MKVSRIPHSIRGRILRWMMLVVMLPASAVVGQRRERTPAPGPAGALVGEPAQARLGSDGSRAEGPMLIETSAPIASLLTKAEDAIARKDWKLAIDSLQRVIDDRSGTLVPRSDGADEDGILFESARRSALRRLASLSAEGMTGYRILLDGKAKGLFDRALDETSEAGLRAVVERFLLTRYGDDAANLLASQAIDAGRYEEAIGLLNDVVQWTPDFDVPPERIFGKLATAYLLSGNAEEAERVLESARERLGDRFTTSDWLRRLLDGQADAEWIERTRRCIASRESGGGGSRAGLHGPAVDPTINEHSPWRYPLPGSTSDLWRRIKDDDGGGTVPPIPRCDVVTDGQRIFVRTEDGCTALNMDDLELAWQLSTARAFGYSIYDTLSGTGRAAAFAAEVAGPYADDPSNAISQAHGLVFTIERSGAGEFLDRDETAGQRILFLRQPTRTFRGFRNATRLVALDAATGAPRWHRGRTETARDILGDVRFLWTPIAVGDSLWVPYLQGGDVFIGVLRPSDGTLTQTIHLGTAQEVPEIGEPPAPATLKGGTVYVPTGFGAVYAVDAERRSLRWAYLYESRLNPGRRTHPGMYRFWMASPPVVSGGTVLLTALDSPEMLALDALSGELRWKTSVEGCSYLIGAENGRVWLGGRRITCLRLSDGRPEWTTHLMGVPTGKAALCGDRIHVPTGAGLVTLEADTGTPDSQQPLPGAQPPLGNLACMGTALFSLDPSSARKFPDLPRTRESSLAILSSDPLNVRATVDLAWSELLSNRPEEAVAAVDRVADGPASVAATSDHAVRRVRFEALMSMANRAKTIEEAMRFLQAAESSAWSAASRLRYRVAAAEKLAQSGRSGEAYRRLLEVGLSADANEMVAGDEGVMIRVRSQIGRRLREWRDRLGETEVHRIANENAERVAALWAIARSDAEPRSARDALLAFTELEPESATSQQILVEIADREATLLQYERAEQRLRQAARIGADDGWTIAAMMRLCEMYAAPETFSPGLLAECLRELESRFADAATPGEPYRREESAAGAGTRRVAEWTASLRERTDRTALWRAESLAASAGADGPRYSLGGGYAWAHEPVEGGESGEPGRMVQFPDDPPPALTDRIITLSRDGYVECLEVERKQTLWRSHLRPSGTATDLPPTLGARGQSYARYGVADGQTAALASSQGIFGIGALTGRLLWELPFDGPIRDFGGAAGKDRAMAARDGLLAAQPREGRLSLIRMADGSTIWERELFGESAALVWMDDKSVAFSDAGQRRLHILDRRDGRLIRLLQFRQPEPESERIDLVLTDGMVYGPESVEGVDAVAAYDLSTGDRRWGVGVTKPVVSLFELKPGHLGIGLLGGDVKVVEKFTGRIALERSDPSTRACIGGALWEGTMILRNTGPHGSRQASVLAAFDIATGAEVWRRPGITAFAGNPTSLTIVGGVIPVLTEQTQVNVTKGGVATPRGAAAATLIDVRTGNDSGRSVDLQAAMQGVTLNGDVVFRPGVLMVGTIKGIQAIRADATVDASGNGS